VGRIDSATSAAAASGSTGRSAREATMTPAVRATTSRAAARRAKIAITGCREEKLGVLGTWRAVLMGAGD
jgi:hypothetical protein